MPQNEKSGLLPASEEGRQSQDDSRRPRIAIVSVAAIAGCFLVGLVATRTPADPDAVATAPKLARASTTTLLQRQPVSKSSGGSWRWDSQPETPPETNLPSYDQLLSAHLPASKEACLDDFTEEYNANCMTLVENSKKVELEKALQSCVWQKDGTSQTDIVALHGPPPYISDEKVLALGSYGMERCIIEDPGPPYGSSGSRHGRAASHTESHQSSGTLDGAPHALGRYEIYRIGPFNTTGGKDWTSIQTTDMFCNDAPGEPRDDIPQADYDALCTDVTKFTDFGKDLHWPDPNNKVFAIREYVLATMFPNNTVAGYPPLHQHHYHLEETLQPGDEEFRNAVITHGDDQCLQSTGGDNCFIFRMIPGYATMMRAPLRVTADFNDVRPKDSPSLQWYALISVRGFPDDGTFKPFTQLMLDFWPQHYIEGYFKTYEVPADKTTAFWREGEFLVDKPILWTYFHNHPGNAQEVLFYIGATGTQFGMASSDWGSGNLTYVAASQVDTMKSHLDTRAAQIGARKVCAYSRNNKTQNEIYTPSAEDDDMFWRKVSSCVPFSIRAHMPFVVAIISAPAGPEAANIHGERFFPDAKVALEHTVIRLFTSLDEYPSSTCGEERCFRTWGPHNAEHPDESWQSFPLLASHKK